MMRDPRTGALLEDRPPARHDWRDDLVAGEEAVFDLDLLPTHQTFAYLRARAEAAAKEGVTMTADIQQLMGRRVDEPLRGTVAIMPRDERVQRDLHGNPLAIFDAGRPGELPMLLVTGGQKRFEHALELAREARHYGHDRVDARDYPQPNVEAGFWRWVQEAQDHKVGRRRYAYTKFKGLADGKDWIG